MSNPCLDCNIPLLTSCWEFRLALGISSVDLPHDQALNSRCYHPVGSIKVEGERDETRD